MRILFDHLQVCQVSQSKLSYSVALLQQSAIPTACQADCSFLLSRNRYVCDQPLWYFALL